MKVTALTGTIRRRHGLFYAVTRYYDESGKRREKWATPGHNTKRAAHADLSALLGQYRRNAQGVEHPELETAYARSAALWRSPIFHAITAMDRHQVLVTHDTDGARLDGTDGPGPYVREPWATWICSPGESATINPAAVMTSIPEGYQLCQRCAYAIGQKRHREAESATPNMARHLERTDNLLNS